MILYACASSLLGCTGIPYIAQRSLAVRGFDASLSLPLRMLLIAICASGAIAAWLVFDSVVACLSFSFACACISAIVACDLREHIIPTGLAVLMTVFGLTFRITMSGLGETVSIMIPVAALAFCLLTLNHARAQNGKTELIGSGDVRMLVPLALFSGWDGLSFGVTAASITLCVIAIIQLAQGRANMQTNIALAPGLAAWLFAGALIPLL